MPDTNGLVVCVGHGTDDSGCGEMRGESGYACDRCGGMLLTKTAVEEADAAIAAMRKGEE